MRRKDVRKLSGYNKLPESPYEWDQWKLTKEQKEEYWKIARIHDSFFSMISGYSQSVPKCKIYSPRFIKHFFKTHKISDIYVDYASTYISTPGFHMFSAYTPYGIQGIDSAFAKQIRSIGQPECLFTFEELKECILRHPSLHPIIRNNLYSNLLSYVQVNSRR